MPEFLHRSATADGRIETGRLLATSESEAAVLLRRRGLIPLSVSTGRGGSLRDILAQEIALSSVPLRRRCQRLAEDAATLAGAGLPIADSLQQAVSHGTERRFAERVRAVAGRVDDGISVSTAFREADFPDLMAAFVTTGEATGRIGEGLARYADLENRALQTRDKALSVTIYPIFLAIATVAALVILLIWVVPVFKVVFEDIRVAMPASTRLLIFFSDGLTGNGPAILGILGGLVMTALAIAFTPTLAGLRDRLLLSLPVAGALRADFQRARFMLTCGGLIESGATVPVSLQLAAETLDSTTMRDQALRIADQVREGRHLADAFTEGPLGAPVLAQFAAIGERSGTLAQMLSRAGESEQLRFERRLAALTTALGPALTLFVGVVIGGVAYSVLSAVMGAYDLAQRDAMPPGCIQLAIHAVVALARNHVISAFRLKRFGTGVDEQPC